MSDSPLFPTTPAKVEYLKPQDAPAPTTAQDAPAAPAAPAPTSVAPKAVQSRAEAIVAKLAAERAVAAAPPAPGAAPVGAAPDAEAPAAPVSDAEARNRFALLTKAERKLAEKEKAIRASEAKVAAYEKAMAEAKQDPTAIARALGVSLNELYGTLTDHILGDINKPKVDPMTERLTAAEQKMAQYEQALKAKEEEATQNRISADMHNVIQTKIVPVLNTSPEQYELTIARFGDQTPQIVLDAIWERYSATNGAELWTAEHAASFIESQLQQEADAQLAELQKTKRYADRFGVQAQQAPKPQEVRTAAVQVRTNPTTLTNKHNPVPTVQTSNLPSSLKSDDRIAAILAKRKQQ